MNKIYNYFLLIILACVNVCCSESELLDTPTQAKPGEEVQFGLSFDEKTRTVYGNQTGNAFPIYWVDGDKVQVHSPQCLQGRTTAEYQVSVTGTTQNYADNLTRTGEFGVQWGSEDKAIFYSIYPSGDYVFDEDDEENVQVKGLKIADFQEIKVNATNEEIGDADMKNCLMYAVNDGGEANGNLGVPKSDATVELQYSPISTVIYVTLKVAANEDATADNFTIQNVRLIAPANTTISGSFSWDCATKSVVADSFVGGSNQIVSEIVDGNNFHTLTNGESISFPMFIAPVSGLTVDKNWKLQVVVAGGATYTKSLNINMALTPGQIHKITLPELKPSTTEWQVSNWMTNIPRNVYLSEVSIPGSWNSLNGEFNTQSTDATATIDNQYNIGIRAYHLDTRWQGGGSTLRPTISDVLGVADGGNTVEYTNNGRVMTDSDNPSISDCLSHITSNLKPEEYMVLICTFAQGSHNHTTADGKDWVGAISAACAANEKVFDAKKLNANTVIGEVLNSLIVIVNLEGAVGNVPSDSKCLFVNMPLKLDKNTFTTNLTSAIYKGATNSTTAVTSGINMYHTQAQCCISDSYKVPSGQSTDNVDQRGYAPTFSARKDVANTILEDSRNNHADMTNYKHNEWIYLGLGGYYMTYSSGFIGIGAGWKAADNGHTNVAKDCNDWINSKVTEMGTIPAGQTTAIPYYPVGTVLMNKVEDYAQTVKNILLINTKYRLQRDPNRPSTSEGYALQQADYDGSVNSGGNAVDTK